MVTIKRISPLSAATLAGLMYAIIGLVLGLLFTAFSGFLKGPAGTAPPGPFFGPAAIILLPLFYGVIGFVFTWIGAWLYNLLAGKVGGIQIEIETPPANSEAPALAQS
jgi:hypothetical protein